MLKGSVENTGYQFGVPKWGTNCVLQKTNSIKITDNADKDDQ